MSTFTLNISRFVETTKGDLNKAVRTTVFFLYGELSEGSPVGDPLLWENPSAAPPGYTGGRFKGNWQLGVGVVTTGTLNAIDKDGSLSKERILSGIPEQAYGKIYYITNNLPYAQRLEDGHSKQAPFGMVAKAGMRFNRIVDAAVYSVRKGESV